MASEVPSLEGNTGKKRVRLPCSNLGPKPFSRHGVLSGRVQLGPQGGKFGSAQTPCRPCRPSHNCSGFLSGRGCPFSSTCPPRHMLLRGNHGTCTPANVKCPQPLEELCCVHLQHTPTRAPRGKMGSHGHALQWARPIHLRGPGLCILRLPRESQDSGTHLCTEASYTPLSPATDSSDTAAETQGTFRLHPWAVFIAGGRRGEKEGWQGRVPKPGHCLCNTHF